MGKVKTISEVIELIKSGYTPKENFLFQNTIYKFDSDLDLQNKFMYMEFKHDESDSLSTITFFFNAYGRLKWIDLSYYNLVSPNHSVKRLDYCIYDNKWSYEQKRDAYNNFGIL